MSTPQAPLPVDSTVWLRPLLRGLLADGLRYTGTAGLFAAILAWGGFQPQVEALLLAPKFSIVLLVAFGAAMAWQTTLFAMAYARRPQGELESLWTPIKVILLATIFLPAQEGVSSLVHFLVWVGRAVS